jgi:hypothetical protein
MYSSVVERVKVSEKPLPHYFMTGLKLFLYTPRRHMEEWKYNSIHSQPWQQMGVSGQMQCGSSATTDKFPSTH